MQVVKRDGRVMEFNQRRIVDAIEKAMNQTPDGIDEELAIKIASSVEKQLESRSEVSVYEIQDIVEKKLMVSSRKEVATAYITYRYTRDVARKSKTKNIFLDLITSKYKSPNDKGILYQSINDIMLSFASESIKPYVDTILLSKDVLELEKQGFIDLVDKSLYPTKAIKSFMFPLDFKLKTLGKKGNIEYAVICIYSLLKSLEGEVCGDIIIPSIDYVLAPFVKKTYDEEVANIQEILGCDFEDEKYFDIARNKMKSRVCTSLKFLISNIDSIGIGLSDSADGKLISNTILELILKEDYNLKNLIFYYKSDVDSKLFENALSASLKKPFLIFVNLNATYNQNSSDYSFNRGNAVAEVILNLPKIACEFLLTKDTNLHENANIETNENIEEFIKFIKPHIKIAVKSLVERFRFQATALKKQFPKLMSGLWKDSSKLDDYESVENILRYGNFEIGIVGLAECLKVLNGKHHGESEASLKIGKIIIIEINKQLEEFSKEYNLKFILKEAEDENGRFISKDREIYTALAFTNNKSNYTYGVSIPDDYKVDSVKKIRIESQIHEILKDGCVFISKSFKDVDDLKEIINIAIDNNTNSIRFKI